MHIVSLVLPILALLQPTATAPPRINVRLYAAQQSLQPGGQTDLAIEINVEKGWHVYHPIILDSGAPTTISFAVPPGVTFGELRFPVPRLGQDGDLKYLALDGQFYILTTLKLAADYHAGTAPIKVDVSALVCKELCVPADRSATLTLKVSDRTPAPANEALFKKARDALPTPLADAPHLKGSAVAVSKEKLGFEEPAEVVLSVRVEKGHHVLDRDPGNETLIPSQLFVEPLDGLRFDEQQWPEAKVRQVPVMGRVRELGGEFQIRVPFAIIDREFASGPVALRVLFTYQVCSDAGVCFPPETADGVVRFTADTPGSALTDAADRGTLLPRVTVAGAATSASLSVSGVSELLMNIILGFLGGLLLNVMPCVFPVISIKVIGFIKQAGEDRGRVLRLGLAFAAGIMVWFWVFGYLSGKGQVPLQHPPVAIGLTALFFVLALNLFGVYEIVLPGAATEKLGQAATREGYSGAFLKGLLATLLGTACTAPAFAGAAAYASTQPPLVGFLVFTAAGVGMSLPYVLLAAYPAWLKRLPKPGRWLVTFKQAMGFVLLATAVWLLLIVGDLLNAGGVVWTVAFLGFLGLSTWLIGKIQLNWETHTRVLTWLCAVAVGLLGFWFCFIKMYDLRAAMQPGGAAPETPATRPADVSAAADAVLNACATADWSTHIPWQPWQPGLPEELAQRGHPVFVDFTATWCVTCQTNKATSVETESTRAKLRDLGVIPLKGDYTKQDPTMRAELLKYGHNSVPLDLVFPAGRPDAPLQLPVLLTPGIVSDALSKAKPESP